MPKLYDIMAPTGKYTDKQGQEKTRWLKCGMVVQTAAGKMAIKLDALPVNPMSNDGEDTGLWLQLFEPNQPQDDLHTAAPPQGGFRQPAPQAAQPNAFGAPQQGAPAPVAAAPMGNPNFAPATPPAPAQGVTPPPPAGGYTDDDIPF